MEGRREGGEVRTRDGARATVWIASLVGLLLPLLAACAGQQVVTASAEQRRPAERVQDPMTHLPDATFPDRPPVSHDPAAVQAAPVLVPQVEAPGEPFFLFDIPFEFDQANLRMDARDMVEVNAMRLKERDRRLVLTLEGRCDEIGTAEYNFILGERRAMTVKSYLISLGLPGEAIEVVSYGRERPLCFEHSQDCWAKNRTVRFVTQ